MNVTLLLIHLLFASALLGAITHQAASVLAPVNQPSKWFFTKFRAVNGAAYVNAVSCLFVVTFLLGFMIYPNYRISARLTMEQFRLVASIGSFELKEHIVALGFGLLPAYWWLWQSGQKDFITARRIVTLILTLSVWYAFIIGHFLNNTRGITG